MADSAYGRTLRDRFTSLFELSREAMFQSEALANPHCAVVYCPVVCRGDKGCDILEVANRLRINIAMWQGVQDGALKSKDAYYNLARIVTRWEDDPVCSWVPLFERLWAGMYCAVHGADAVTQSDAALEALWPEATDMPRAVFNLRCSEIGLDKILVRQRKMPVPVNFDTFHVFVAVTKKHLGFDADYSASSPYDVMPDLFIIGSDARWNGYPTVFSDAAVREPDNWRAAIHWLLEQGLPGEDCLNGLVMMIRRTAMFISPQASVPYSDRLDIRSGGIIKQTDSLPLFNAAVDPAGFACTGLTALYNEATKSDRRVMAAHPGHHLGANTAVGRLMHAILADSRASRASTNHF